MEFVEKANDLCDEYDIWYFCIPIFLNEVIHIFNMRESFYII